MLKTLFPYIKLYKHYFWLITLGMLLALLTIAASVFLLSLSGWFLASTAFVGFAGLYTFNYMLPAAGVRGAAIFRTAARYFERLVNHDTTFQILTFLRTRAFKAIIPFSAHQLAQYQKADLLNRFIADIDNLDHLYLKLFVPIISALAISLLIFIGLGQINLLLATMITVILLITILIIPIIFYQAGKMLGTQLSQQKSQYRTQLVNYLQGQAELSLFNANRHYRQLLDELESNWLVNQAKQAKLMSLASGLIILIIGIMTSLIIWIAAEGIEHYAPPMIALFVFISLSCGEILAPIPNAFIFLGQVLTSAERMSEITNQKPAVTFPPKGAAADLNQATLTFSNVIFGYPNQPLNVLTAVNFTIKNGEHIGLIGPSGCGKSTLINLITRSWLPSSGTITINQIPIEHYDEPTLRNFMSVIPQTITIFSDTLRNNLLIGNEQATDLQLIEVLTHVGLDKLLATDEKLDLWLGERGRTLSGGEKRRIGIARALLHDAPLILMDEPTESLDATTEKQILAIIKQYYKNRTVIMVTHRLTEHNLFDRTFLLTGQKIDDISSQG